MADNHQYLPPAYTSQLHDHQPAKTLTEALKSAVVPRFLFGKSSIEIVLAIAPGQIPSYSTNDEIRGHINLKLEEKIIEIVELSVILEGTAATRVEDASAARLGAYIHGEHTFLRVTQRIENHQLVLKNFEDLATVHTIPFEFVIPERLLSNTCSHKSEHPDVKNAHLHLPPTIGDPAFSRNNLDDMAPEMAKIAYAIKVRGTARNISGDLIELTEATKSIRVMPMTEEQPPMILDEQNSGFRLREVKNLTRGFFPGRNIGQLTVEMAQPSGFRLPVANMEISNETTTMINIALRFEAQNPADEPPQLQSLDSKIHVYTFFGAAPYNVLPLPRPSQHQTWSNLHGQYATSVKFSSHRLSAVIWERHTNVQAKPSGVRTGSTFYTATLNIPLSLPNKTEDKRVKFFAPSFHSCLVSRCYSLSLCLSFSNSSGSIFNSRIKLVSPVQIFSESPFAESISFEKIMQE